MIAAVRICALIALLAHVVTLPAFAQTQERRVALAIGHCAYKNAPASPNTSNDTCDTAEALRKVGFEVVDGIDPDKRGMDAAQTRVAGRPAPRKPLLPSTGARPQRQEPRELKPQRRVVLDRKSTGILTGGVEVRPEPRASSRRRSGKTADSDCGDALRAQIGGSGTGCR